MQHARWHRQAVLTIAAAIVGYAAWGGIGLTPLSILLPLFWSASRSRPQAMLVVFTYYMASSRVIPLSASVFFGESSSLQLGLLLWLTSSFIHAAVWTLFWADKPWASLIWRLVLIQSLLILPPIGIIGWTNPLLGGMSLYPGLGWAGVAMGLASIMLMAVIPKERGKMVLDVGVIMAIASMISMISYTTPAAPNGWVAVGTNMGKFPSSLQEISKRIVDVGETVRKHEREGHTVIILPEQILGRWDSRIHPAMLRAELGQTDATIVLGAELPIQGTLGADNALVVFTKPSAQIIRSRQSVPVSMWKPWSNETVVSHWWQSGVHDIAGHKVAVSLCYEDFLIWPILSDFLLHKPEMIVSAANGWWVKGTDEQELQNQHISVWAQTFGVPLLRALNAS